MYRGPFKGPQWTETFNVLKTFPKVLLCFVILQEGFNLTKNFQRFFLETKELQEDLLKDTLKVSDQEKNPFNVFYPFVSLLSIKNHLKAFCRKEIL